MIAIGIDIGGTNVKCVVVKPDGTLVASRSFPTSDATDGWKAGVARAVEEMEKAHGAAVGVGISSPGLASRDQRTIQWMMGRMSSLTGFDFTAHLKRDRLVPVMNDAHAALLGEAWIGAASGAQNVVLLTLGTGVGGAILCDGRILKGHLGRAGHLGHITVDPNGPLDIVNTPGSLEDAFGDHTIAMRTGGRFASTADLVRAARDGDAYAKQTWADSIRVLAAGIAGIINAVDPEIVVLGGGIAKAGDELFVPLSRELDRVEWRPIAGERVRLVPAKLGDLAGAYGAAKNALEQLTT
jgi:glucokinase